MSPLIEALIKVKQEMFNEMVEGNGRQPAEVVDMVCYALIDATRMSAGELREVLDFYPDYTGDYLNGEKRFETIKRARP